MRMETAEDEAEGSDKASSLLYLGGIMAKVLYHVAFMIVTSDESVDIHEVEKRIYQAVAADGKCEPLVSRRNEGGFYNPLKEMDQNKGRD